MQFLSNTLHFTELNYSSKFMWFLEIFKLKSSPFFETFQHYFCDNIFFLNITWFISSPDVRQYLRQCVRHHPETVLWYGQVGPPRWKTSHSPTDFLCLCQVPFRHAESEGIQQVLPNTKSSQTETWRVFPTCLVLYKWNWHEYGTQGKKNFSKVVQFMIAWCLGLPRLPSSRYLCSFK